MELCDCSVLNMLDQPEYIYGFPDKEFLQILGDTSKLCTILETVI